MDASRATSIERRIAKALESGDMEAFGGHIKAHLDRHGITLSEFADTVGLSRPTVYRMFRSERDPRKHSIDRVLNGIGLKLSVVSKA